MEASPTAVLIADREGTIVLVNRELERQFGYEREELIGQNVDRLLPESLRAIHACHRADFAAAPESRPMDAGRQLHGLRKDGSEFAVEVALNPVRTSEGLFVIASVMDINERRRLEDAHRAALEEQLEFERFVTELSSQFINLPDDQVDAAIRNGLAHVCTRLGLDRSTFYRIQPAGMLTDA